MADPERAANSHIQYVLPDDKNEGNTTVSPLSRLDRRNSHASDMSIQTMSARSVNLQATIPIEYRTLSIAIDEENEKAGKTKDINDEIADELSKIEWHRLTPTELCRHFDTSLESGLKSEQIQARLLQYGKNSPTPPPSRLAHRLFMYFFGGFGALLLIGGILCLIAWRPLGDPPASANAALGVVLILVFFIQAGFNAWQDWSSSKVMASITTMLPDQCLVLRAGSQTEVSAVELVPGDIIYIKAGNKVPADFRIVQASADLKFDRAILTGESKALAGTVESSSENYLETRCIGLQGTHCISGSAIGVSVDTGDNTVFGRIAKLSSKPKKGLTNLQWEILRFVLVVISFVLFIIFIVIVLWAAWLRKSHPDWINVPLLVVDCVSVAVAFIPEGLPIALTTCLTITARAMKNNKVLCKSLSTVETLGSVSLICSDKTGTLTKNQMFVTDFSIADRRYTLSKDEKAPVEGLAQIQTVAGLCNAARFDATTEDRPLDERKIHGDATDQAILRFAETLGPLKDLHSRWRKVVEIPFNSKNKFMVSLVSETENDDNYVLLMKGAPDILANRCSRILQPDGTVKPLTDETRKEVQETQFYWGLQGKRVLLLAKKVLPKNHFRKDPDTTAFADEVLGSASNLTIVGLVGIVDPPRDEIPEVMKTLQEAGIRVFMVTGDFKLTAQAIARQCGILNTPQQLVHDCSALDRQYTCLPPIISKEDQVADWSSRDSSEYSAIVLEGPELMTLNENQWDQLAEYKEVIFSRTTPEQKLNIVKAFQKRGDVVAMTGDGVNDAPALKAADIGIALGSGSDIAIEAADMVLLDSFSAIVSAVASGRLVFDNLRKTICYLLPAGTFSELWPVMINVLFGLPQNLSSFLMIIICCFTDCAGAMTLAYEKPESDILTRRPRNIKKDHLVDGKLLFHAYIIIGMIECTTSMAMSFWHLQRKGIPFGALFLKYGKLDPKYNADYVSDCVDQASSIYFVNLVVMQMFNLLAARTRRLSILQQPPIFNKRTQNLYLFPAMAFALCVIFIFCYLGVFQNLIGSTRVPVEYFFLPVGFGCGILLIDEGRKYCVRKWPKCLLGRIAW